MSDVVNIPIDLTTDGAGLSRLPALPQLPKVLHTKATDAADANSAAGPSSATKVASSSSWNPFAWWDGFTKWFDPVRLVTVIIGLMLFGVGLFMLTQIPQQVLGGEAGRLADLARGNIGEKLLTGTRKRLGIKAPKSRARLAAPP